MPAPVVSWYDSANAVQQTEWALGTLDAGSTSADTQFLIWNNRGGVSAVSDMTGCAITTKDTSGGDTGDVVTGTWTQVRVDKLGEGVFTPVGGATTHVVGNGVTAQTIAGAANDGTVANSNPNYTSVTLHLAIPANAAAGARSWLVRVQYSYV